jgi:hypothetical protein
VVTGAVTGMPPPGTLPLPDEIHLGWDSLETCDGCGPGISAIWRVFTGAGDLTFCGEHYRRFRKARKEMNE